MPDLNEINATDNPSAQHANRCFFMALPTNHMWRGSESRLFIVDSDIDLRVSDVFYKNLTSNVTFTFSNPPKRNIAKKFTLIVNKESDYSVTWPNGVTWVADDVPTLKTGLNVFDFLMYNDIIIGSVVTDTSGAEAAVASQLNNAFTIKLNSGTVEGRSKYTFDGSAAKTLDLKPGTNISMTSSNGSTTISAVAPSIKVGASGGIIPDIYESASLNGETTLRMMSGSTVNGRVRIYGNNGIEVTTESSSNDICITNTDITRCYPIAKDAIAEIVNNETLVDKTFVTGEHGALTIKFYSSQNSVVENSEECSIKVEQRDFNLYSNTDHEIIPIFNNTYSYYDSDDVDLFISGEFDFETKQIDGISVMLESNGYESTGNGNVTFSTVGSIYPGCSNSSYSTWNYVVDNVYDGTDESLEYCEAWNAVEFDPSTLANAGDEITIALNYKHIGGGGSDSSEDVKELQTIPNCRLRIRREANGKYRLFINYIVTETNNVDFEEINSGVKVVKYADANALKEIINLIPVH